MLPVYFLQMYINHATIFEMASFFTQMAVDKDLPVKKETEKTVGGQSKTQRGWKSMVTALESAEQRDFGLNCDSA